MDQKLTRGITKFIYLDQAVMELDEPVALPLGTRVQVEKLDYIVENVRIAAHGSLYDIYYDVYLAETTGTVPPLL